MADTAPAALAVRGLTKRYGAMLALSDASFDLAGGEVLSVLGQNGAGKSTLVKMLAGALTPTAGSVAIDGAAVQFRSARDALAAGVVLIPQELAYLPELSVAENIVLGDWPGRGGIVAQRANRAAAAPYAEAVGLSKALGTPMSALSLAECQLVEIAKALHRRARVLLLDEPTAALSDAEARRLFDALAELRERSVAMIYISHRLDEVLTRTDRVLVLRDGRTVADRATRGATRRELIDAMLGPAREAAAGQAAAGQAPAAGASAAGASVAGAPQAPEAAPTPADRRPVVALQDVWHRGRGLRGVTCEIFAGEIVGLYGIAGSRHEAIAELLAGLRPHDGGELLLDGLRWPPLKSPRQARKAGVLYVPPERKTQGLVLSQSVRRNVTFPQLRRFARWGVMRPRAEEAAVRRAASGLSLRYGSSGQAVEELSGGNQQKVLLASRIYADPSVLVIQEPSRGVDVAARLEIHQLLLGVARDGGTIVFATADVEEAVALSDRLLIVRDGRVESELTAERKTEANALAAAGRIETEGR